jgi:hypothetical protein
VAGNAFFLGRFGEKLDACVDEMGKGRGLRFLFWERFRSDRGGTVVDYPVPGHCVAASFKKRDLLMLRRLRLAYFSVDVQDRPILHQDSCPICFVRDEKKNK